jgi:CheY-like chemotaxis protein
MTPNRFPANSASSAFPSEPQIRSARNEEGQAAGGGRRGPGVLVVDDEYAVRVIVQLVLEDHGFQVWQADSGRAAIDLYRQHRDEITVVLVDISMPGLDGPRTLDALRQLNPEVVVAFMSGDLESYQANDLLGRGARCLIAKPCPVGDLVDIVRSLSNGKPPVVLSKAPGSPR